MATYAILGPLLLGLGIIFIYIARKLRGRGAEECLLTKDIDILERQLKKVSALLILYGHVTDEWVKHRLGTALKFSLVNSIPIKSFCVVNVPPPKPREKLDFRIGNIPINMVNTDQNNLNAKNFSSILHALNSRVPA